MVAHPIFPGTLKRNDMDVFPIGYQLGRMPHIMAHCTKVTCNAWINGCASLINLTILRVEKAETPKQLHSKSHETGANSLV